MFYPKAEFCPFNTDEPDCSPCGEKITHPFFESECSKNNMEPESRPDTQCEMMNKIREVSFAMTDLNLFLDTHPDCAQALELYTKLAATLKSLKSDYQSKFGPLYARESSENTPFDWVEDGYKWPWEM